MLPKFIGWVSRTGFEYLDVFFATLLIYHLFWIDNIGANWVDILRQEIFLNI